METHQKNMMLNGSSLLFIILPAEMVLLKWFLLYFAEMVYRVPDFASMIETLTSTHRKIAATNKLM